MEVGMDSATKEVLLNLLRNLIQSTENTYYCYEMTWRTHAFLLQKFPDEYPIGYREAKGVSFEKLDQWRADQLRQLSAAIQLIESWR
jgi:hypothetical protein